MTALTAIFYVSTAIFLAGMGWRLFTWLRTPVPLKIVLTPGPVTTGGVFRRLAGEALLFRSLYRSDRGLWLAAWSFHVSVVLLATGHVAGLVIPGFVQALFGLTGAEFHRWAQVTGGAFGILAAGSLIYLLLRRVAAERVRYLSTYSDYFALGLLLMLVGSGNHMRFLGGLELEQAREFVSGLLRFQPAPAPDDPTFAAHLLLVCALLVYLPFSKLVHLGGLVLSPPLNQRNNPREKRYA
ncbi:MAG TPA: respiratory nitrate reductase subunit gamma [Verrucomicrobiae bacterium]